MRFFGFNISRVGKSPVTSHQSPVTKSVSFADAWLRGEDTNMTGSVLTNAYEQSIWVYRSINALAEQIANIPFLFSRGERGRETLITSGPLLNFYKDPHPHLNRFQYWELRIIWLMLRGECFRVPIFESSSSSSSYSSSLPSLSASGGEGRGVKS